MSKRIAILGWGSLIWDDDPKFDTFNSQRSEWKDDGPQLPLEFSRVSGSRSNALTLVIDPKNGARCQVAFALSKRQTIADTINDLAERESIAKLTLIGSVCTSHADLSNDRSVEFGTIHEWARSNGLDGVVWTALGSNFQSKTGMAFNVANAVAYVGKLKGKGRLKAREYVERAPEFIKTPAREPLRVELTKGSEVPDGQGETAGATQVSAKPSNAFENESAANAKGSAEDARRMTLNEYQDRYFPIYEAFANTVRFIIEQALQAADSLPRPQSIQSRAKTPESVRRRLTEAGKLDTNSLDRERRDLAGARLIFYTNNDVERFLASPLVHENFEIEEESTKIHHPTPDKQESRYRAVHYTVRLGTDRIKLPEYRRFAGLRCEIQVQTILNHAWSETSHDILYKTKLGNGYGSRAMQAIKRRFERIMDEYLIPAGFEVQKAQQEYERLLQGKDLFDKDVARLLDNAQNNNERYEILSGLKDYAIPNYDDLPAAYEALRGPLLRAAIVARSDQQVPIETTFGKMPGFRGELVVKLVVEIVERLRYVDVTGTLQLLIDIFRGEGNERLCKQIVTAVEHLAEYNLTAYKQVGPALQMALVDHIAGMRDAEVDGIRPIALTVWREAIQSDITGTEWKADSVVLRTGAVQASDQLKGVRNKAITALFEAYDRSIDDSQRRQVLSALDAATRTPHQGQYSNDLQRTTLRDAKRIVDFVKDRAKGTSFELLQHLEHRFLYDSFRSRPLTTDPENRFGCQKEATALIESIFAFRDLINTDQDFVRYKVLVGYESVYPDDWRDERRDFQKVDRYRRAEAARYICQIDDANEDCWLTFIERCASTKSNDMATFPVFGEFISTLAERKPETAARFLAKASGDLRNFLPGFLNGLAKSSRRDVYERALESELTNAKSLNSLARHFRYSEVENPAFVTRLLNRAIDSEVRVAVVECFLFALQHYGTGKIVDPDVFVRDSLTFLNARKDSRWISDGWFLQNADSFYEQLTAERLAQLIENLSYAKTVDFHIEHVLVRLFERWPEQIWDYFGIRLSKEVSDGDGEERYEAIPFTFHELNKVLSKDPRLAIRKGLSWFARDRQLFQFRGGRVLSNAFPDCSPEFATALVELIKGGADGESEFALAVLQNYRGEASTHVVLREIVSRFSEDETKISAVKTSIDSTGVVSGDLGFAEAWRARKELLAEWLTDDRLAVTAFAERHIAEMDRMIVLEHRRAEIRREMWNRDFEDDDNSK